MHKYKSVIQTKICEDDSWKCAWIGFKTETNIALCLYEKMKIWKCPRDSFVVFIEGVGWRVGVTRLK
jgi:hypothetical protein